MIMILLFCICAVLLVLATYAVGRADYANLAYDQLYSRVGDLLKKIDDKDAVLEYYRRFYREAKEAGFVADVDRLFPDPEEEK